MAYNKQGGVSHALIAEAHRCEVRPTFGQLRQKQGVAVRSPVVENAEGMAWVLIEDAWHTVDEDFAV